MGERRLSTQSHAHPWRSTLMWRRVIEGDIGEDADVEEGNKVQLRC